MKVGLPELYTLQSAEQLTTTRTIPKVFNYFLYTLRYKRLALSQNFRSMCILKMFVLAKLVQKTCLITLIFPARNLELMFSAMIY